MVPNVYEKVLEHRGERLRGWDGDCHRLAYTVSCYLDAQDIAHKLIWICPVDPDGELVPAMVKSSWRFHVVVELCGVIHDPWFGPTTPLEEYLPKMFPDQYIRAVRGDYTLEDLEQLADEEASL